MFLSLSSPILESMIIIMFLDIVCGKLYNLIKMSISHLSTKPAGLNFMKYITPVMVQDKLTFKSMLS